jgi:hypothetical protein
MIRAVQEFFCVHGRCREVQLAGARHYPILLSIEQMPRGIALPDRGTSNAPGLRITYRGHKEDLIALGCIARDSLATARYGRYQDDPRGATLHVANKAAPGRRRMIELSFFTRSRSFARILPGVCTYCDDWLEALTARPTLRLVVDNSRTDIHDGSARRKPHAPRALRTGNQ